MGKALSILLVMLVAATAGASEGDFEAHVLQLLELRSPEAVPVYREAGRAHRAGDAGAAAASYRKVLELAPDFAHALRRLCQVEAELGEQGTALEHCRRAVAIERSADNLASLAMVLVNMGTGGDEASVREALQHARDAARVDRSSIAAQTVLCQVAILADDVATLARCVEQLEQLAPDDPVTYMFAASFAVAQERWADARALLERARQRGLSQETYVEIEATIAEHERLAPWKLFALLVVGLLALLCVGYLAVAARRRRATTAG